MGSSRGTGLSGAIKQSVSNVSQQTGGATPLMSGSSFVPGVSTASPKNPLEAQEAFGMNSIEEPFGGLGGVRGAALAGRPNVTDATIQQPSVQVKLSGSESKEKQDERERREASIAPPILNEEKAQEAKDKSKDWLTRVSAP